MGSPAFDACDDLVSRAIAGWSLPQPLVRVEALGNAGGFSGSRLWRVVAGQSEFCLRRWPLEHPSTSQLDWIHRMLRQVAERGCHFVPVPLPTRDAGTWIELAGRLWELVPWMPGRADFRKHPSRPRLESAMQCLCAGTLRHVWTLRALSIDHPA